jgi:hypothetical protein
MARQLRDEVTAGRYGFEGRLPSETGGFQSLVRRLRVPCNL